MAAEGGSAWLYSRQTLLPPVLTNPSPSPSPLRCWPLVLAGRDVEALAEPGSGKTLAYLLPAAVVRAHSVLWCWTVVTWRMPRADSVESAQGAKRHTACPVWNAVAAACMLTAPQQSLLRRLHTSPPALQLLASMGHGADSRPDGPLALILLPTRELAQQVGQICLASRQRLPP